MSIQTELVIIDGIELKKTYSDAGKFIQRDGVVYVEAIDPTSFNREYIETDENIPTDDEPTLRKGRE